MMGQKTKEYISAYGFCSELLFKDWELFLDVLYSEGHHVSAILWWDHCKKTEHPESVGSGGYPDPDDSDYLYAETQFYEEGFEPCTVNEIKDYIAGQRKAGLRYGSGYVGHDLVPSFYLADESNEQKS